MEPESSAPQLQQPTQERLAVLEAEIRGLNNNLSLLTTFAGIVFGLFAVAMAWNVSSERSDLRESTERMKEEVRIALGQQSDQPLIVLLGKDLRPLEGASERAEVVPMKEGTFLSIPIVIRNDGKGWTGEVGFKVYTTSAIKQALDSVEETGFVYEQHWLGLFDRSQPNQATTGLVPLPGGFSFPFRLNLYPQAPVAPGRHPCLVKLYYGRGEVARARFTVVVT